MREREKREICVFLLTCRFLYSGSVLRRVADYMVFVIHIEDSDRQKGLCICAD